LENTYTRDNYNGATGLKLHAAQVSLDLPCLSWWSDELTIETVSLPLHEQVSIPPPCDRLLRYVLPAIHGTPIPY
jgi:hypothetical protein